MIEKLEKDSDVEKRAWEVEKGLLLTMVTQHEDKRRAWEAEKDRLRKMLTEHEEQKSIMEAEIDRLLKTSKELETKFPLGKDNVFVVFAISS